MVILEHDIIQILRNNPQIVIFLALAAGYFIGNIKIFGFTLGPTAGTLLSALVLGQINIEIHPLIKAVFFALFIFTIGYKVGPQFFGSVKKGGMSYIGLSVFFAIVGLATAFGLGKLFHFDSGTTAGIIGGALTQSSVSGTADGAINFLPVAAAQKTLMESNVAIAYTITYLFGVVGLVVFYKIVPRLMKVDLKAEAKKLEAAMSGGAEEELSPEFFAWNKRLDLRAYRVTGSASGRTVSGVEALFPTEVAIDKMKRSGEVSAPGRDTVLREGDIIAIVGGAGSLLKAEEIIGPEVDDKDVAGLIGEILKICVTKRDAIGRTLGQMSGEYGHGCFLKRITRQGHEMPLTKDTVVNKCDIFHVAGSRQNIDKLASYLGYPERPTVATDLISLGIGCIAGTLLGLIAIKVAGIPLTLGIGGGVLVAGLVAGWLRSIHPTFGLIPESAQWVFTNLGLNVFIACVGLAAGPKAIHAIETTGPAIFIAGIILSLVPHICGIVFGKYILRMNPLLLFGALTGAGTVTPALNALKEGSDSALPALGYTIPYAMGNFLLTVWGTVIVHLL